jgi:hypothetical protein
VVLHHRHPNNTRLTVQVISVFAQFYRDSSYGLFLNNQPDGLIIQIYTVIKLHVSGILSAHHQEFSTVHLALVRFVQV